MLIGRPLESGSAYLDKASALETELEVTHNISSEAHIRSWETIKSLESLDNELGDSPALAVTRLCHPTVSRHNLAPRDPSIFPKTIQASQNMQNAPGILILAPANE